MSEVTAPVEPEVTKPEGGTPKPEAPDTTDWKAESRKWEARAKENKSAAEKLQELEDSQKSEIQKAQEAAQTAQAELAKSKAETLRLKIAATHGIGEDHLDLLTGADEEELEAKAKKLSTLIKSTTEEPAPKKGAWAPFDPDEGKSPSSNKAEPVSPGMGRLRAAYEQADN